MKEQDWLKLLVTLKVDAPKPKPKAQHKKVCREHGIKLYGHFPCYKCMENEKFFKGRPDLVTDIRNGNIFAKFTGVNFAAMSPGVRFGIEHEWYETFDIPSGVLKRIVDHLEKQVARHG